MSRENSHLDKQNSTSSHEESLQLKRLLVTMKQKYEQSLQQINSQLQSEIAAKIVLQNDHSHLQKELSEIKKQHEEEHESLIQQQIVLKDLLIQAKKESDDKLKSWQEKILLQNEGDQKALVLDPSIHNKIELLQERIRQQADLQEKYELIKEELGQFSMKFEEALEARVQAEEKYQKVQNKYEELISTLEIKEKTIQEFTKTLENSNNSIADNSRILEEQESKLKVAQQHLAKKVKESALLNEKLMEFQNHINDLERSNEESQFLINRMHQQIETHQQMEKKLQDDLHEALKNNETQIAKWEEKYFRMYDKWQESETKIKELGKFQERHHRLQAILQNLGNLVDQEPTVHQELVSQESFEIPSKSEITQ